MISDEVPHFLSIYSNVIVSIFQSCFDITISGMNVCCDYIGTGLWHFLHFCWVLGLRRGLSPTIVFSLLIPYPDLEDMAMRLVTPKLFPILSIRSDGNMTLLHLVKITKTLYLSTFSSSKTFQHLLNSTLPNLRAYRYWVAPSVKMLWFPCSLINVYINCSASSILLYGATDKYLETSYLLNR